MKLFTIILTAAALTVAAYGQKVPDLTEVTTPAAGDLFSVMDVSDTAQSAQGSTRKLTWANLFKGAAITNGGTVNGLTITTSSGTLTIANSKTLTVSNTLTLAGTDGTTMTFPTTSATVARTDAANTFTGNQTFSGALSIGGATVSSSTNLITPVSATGVSPIRIPHGTAPSSPVNGDIWTTTGGLYVRVNGSTVGPLAASGSFDQAGNYTLTGTWDFTGGTVTFGTVTIGTINAGSVLYTEGAAPGTPAAGTVAVYAKADGLIYGKDDAGAETVLSGGGSATAYDDIGDPNANSTIAFAGFTNTWTSSLDGGAVFSITNSDADAGTATYMFDVGYTDSPDAEANFARFRTTIAGTPVVSYLFGSTAFTIDSTVATSFAGTVAVPTIAGTSDSDTSAASTAFVQGVAALKANLAGGNTFTGTQVFPSGQALIAPALGTIASGNGAALTGLTNIATTAGSATLTSGQVNVNTTNKQLGVHTGTKEVAIPTIQHKIVTFDPAAVNANTNKRLFLMSTGVSEPFGIHVIAWKVSFAADPTTEIDMDLKRADAFIGVANSAVMDVLDTTAGASSEATSSNINSDAVVANGKVLYLELGTAYATTAETVVFEYWYEIEED